MCPKVIEYAKSTIITNIALHPPLLPLTHEEKYLADLLDKLVNQAIMVQNRLAQIRIRQSMQINITVAMGEWFE